MKKAGGKRNKKEALLKARVTAAQAEAVRAAADKKGLTLSSYLRMIIIESLNRSNETPYAAEAAASDISTTCTSHKHKWRRFSKEECICIVCGAVYFSPE